MKEYKKTKCCNFVIDCFANDPIMKDGYCKNCGYHPEIEKLKNCIDRLIGRLNYDRELYEELRDKHE